MTPVFDKTSLPRKVPLNGSDCFHLLLDKHAVRHHAGSNTMRIIFYFNNQLPVDRIKQVFNNSPLIHWLCNIQLIQPLFFKAPYWQYRDKGNYLLINEYEHARIHEIPDIILNRDLPLDGNRFVECDVIHYPGNKSVIVLSWNHILMDGKGIGMLIQHLNDLDGGKTGYSSGTLFPNREKNAGFIAHLKNVFPVKKFIETSSRAPIVSVAFKSSKSSTGFKNSIIRFNPEETKAIHENAIKNGARFGPNLYYLACCAHVVNNINRQRKNEGDLWMPIPYDGRLRGSVGPAISNRVAFLFYRIPKDELTSVKQTVSCMSAQMTDQIKNKMPQKYSMLQTMMRHIPLRLYYFLVNRAGEGNLASFLYSSTGENFNHIKTFFGEYVSDLTIFPSPTFPPGLTFSFLKHNDALNINIVYSPDIVNKFELNAIEQDLKNKLKAESL
jgi:NRPS condensation-like uncharacterized protein